jgi:SAM-dependent methyltransferase
MITHDFLSTRVVRFCPICGGVNNWVDQVEGTLLIKCGRCSIRYNFSEISTNDYAGSFEPSLSHRDLVHHYMSNIKEREGLVSSLISKMCIREGQHVLVIGASIGIYNKQLYLNNVIGIDASARKCDMAHDIYENQIIYHMLAENISFVNRFDVVIINNVLSHSDYPIRVICKAWNALRQISFINNGIMPIYHRNNHMYIIHKLGQQDVRLSLDIGDIDKLVRIALDSPSINIINADNTIIMDITNA